MIVKIGINVPVNDSMEFKAEKEYVDALNNNLYIDEYKAEHDIKKNKTQFEYYEVDALLLDSNREEITIEDIYNYSTNGNKFVLIVNVNPCTIDEYANEELKYWIDDSLRIWGDTSLDNPTKLNVSPTHTMDLITENGETFSLNDCKIFEDYSYDKFPMYFAMLVDNITRK